MKLTPEQEKKIQRNEKKRLRQWGYMKNAEKMILSWSRKNNQLIHRIEFCPHYIEETERQEAEILYGTELNTFKTSLDVLIFYLTDAELKSYTQSGMVEKTKQEFIRILHEIGYVKEFNDIVRFQFDSDENVKKNFEGNYGHRLRG